MVMSQTFTTTSQNIATYDYVDLANGVGFEKFYAGAQATAGATITYKIANQPFYCSRTGTLATQNQQFTKAPTTGYAAATKAIDLDFDSTIFTIPKVLEGVMISNIPIANTANTTSNSEAYCIMTIKTVNPAAAETTIATTTSTTLVSAAGIYGIDGVGDTYFAFNTTIPRTRINKGDFIRITLELWLKQISGVDAVWALAHDPYGSAITRVNNANVALATPGFSAGDSTMTFLLPFEVTL